ncbi:MAG: hypothetical protein U0359_14620 [Byssovorax sp.]
MQAVPCSNCGAMATPQADGRTYRCGYCGTVIQVAVEAAQIAAGMRLDLGHMDTFLTQLATTLSQGFAEKTVIQANGGYVLSVTIDLDPDHYIARREGPRVVAEYKKVVRGVALRTQALPLDQWVEKLTGSLAKHANTNARAAWVLQRLSGGRG